MHAIKLTQVFAHRKILHPPAGQEALHHLLVITEQLGPAGALAHAYVNPRGIFAVAAKLARVHAVVGRGLMQPHKRIGIAPVATGRVMAIHNHHRRCRFRQQSVDKGHANSAAADDEVIG